MKIIEMFGLPYSGKSTMINIVKKSNKRTKTTNYRNTVYDYLFKSKEISSVDYLFLRLSERLREKTHKNNNLKKAFYCLIKLLVLIIPVNKEIINNKINEIYLLNSKKNKVFLNFLIQLNKKYNFEIDKVLEWIKLEITGYNLSKKLKNNYSLNSEGITQRCLSIIMRINIAKKDIKKFLKLCPKPDVLVIFDEKKKITNFLKNSKKISFKKKTFLQNYKFLKENIKKSFRGTLIISSKDKKTLEILKRGKNYEY
tara:strand:+ start:28172 stop:28936 length:765 start_codon:yes stop_codon:yes gene_type:complete